MEGRACKFCGAKQELGGFDKGVIHKTINLEHGRPMRETAIRRLLKEIQTAKTEQVRVLTIIHGYGSTGKGGVIRSESRKTLDYLCSTGEIKEYIPGEDFSGRSGPVKALLRRFPELVNNKNLDRRNPGVTLVIMQ
jgi:DNA-nicking Smr family endonuclease